jgi:hypothetical protein
MTAKVALESAIRKRSHVGWWAYLPAAVVSLLFAIMGWGEEGPSGAALFIILLLVCLVQWLYPTLLVWGLLLILFSAYAVVVIATPHNGTFTDYLVFFLCGAIPSVVLLLGRPKESTRNGY